MSASVEFVRRLFLEGWNEGRFGFLEASTAPAVAMHYNGQTLEVTSESLPALVGMWRDAFPDLDFQIRHLVGDEALVAVSLVFRGTHRGEWWGIPPSGKAVEVEEMMFFRFEGDVLVEMWELVDEQTLRQQIAG